MKRKRRAGWRKGLFLNFDALAYAFINSTKRPAGNDQIEEDSTARKVMIENRKGLDVN